MPAIKMIIPDDEDGYYGVAVVPRGVFDRIPDCMLISGSSDHVKFMCANQRERTHLESIGVDTSGVTCDWFRIELDTTIGT